MRHYGRLLHEYYYVEEYMATGVYCTFDDLIKFLNSVIGDKRVIDADESMLTAAI